MNSSTEKNASAMAATATYPQAVTGLRAFLNISVGRKILMSFSGLFLIGFIIIHLLGNLLFYVSPDAFNIYGHSLSKNRAIYTVLEIIILVGFLAHIALALQLTLSNSKARDVKYKKRKTLGMSSLFSANMGLTGSFVLLFVIVHVRGFRFGEKNSVLVPGGGGETMYDLYTLVLESFQNTGYALLYIVAVLLLGGHLSHGLQSAFKSLGLYSGSLETPLKRLSLAFGIVMALGFASIPLAVMTGLIS